MNRALDIAQRTQAIIATSERVKEGEVGDHHWRWRYADTVVFPDIKCPYCNEGIHTNSLWVVDTVGRAPKLIGQTLVENGKRLRLSAPYHPHCDSQGWICMGDGGNGPEAETPSQALFFGLNPDSTYRDMKEWLGSPLVGHYCDALPESEEDYDSWWCDSCAREYWLSREVHERFFCGNCDEYHCIYATTRNYCGDCDYYHCGDDHDHSEPEDD